MRRIALALLGVAALAGLGWWGYSQVTTGRWRPALSSRELATRTLAQYLAKTHPPAKVLVVGNPFTLRSGQGAEIYAFEKASVRGLQEGFGGGGAALQVAYPELRPELTTVYVGNTTTPLSYLVAEHAFDRLVEAHPGVELLVSLIGLPVSITEDPLWREPGKPRFALLLPDWRIVGRAEAVRQAIKSGKIEAAVIARPGAVSDETPLRPGEFQEEFDRRFILVTTENIDELLQTYPHAF